MAGTIAAIATALGGGIGIVRLSGPDSEAIVSRLVTPWPKSRPPSHKLHLGSVRDPHTGEVIDQVLAVVMRAPRSYTGEDVAELHGHGGALVMRRLLDCALALGARLAEPGEFTRRAFEAGRIDLTRAEAVAQLISAESDKALRAAQSLSSGALAREVNALRGELVSLLAELDGDIDFPDEKLDARPPEALAALLGGLEQRMTELAATFRRAIHDGAEVALVGRVNAGKSSLLNALAGVERALVDAEPGTTRDVVEAAVELGGVRVTLVDTAGERFGDAEARGVEARGVELGRKRRARADAFVLVVDGTVGFGEGERRLYAEAGPCVIAWNKRDVAGAPAGTPPDAVVIETSARTGAGALELGRAIARALGEGEGDPGAKAALHVTARHSEALLAGAAALARAGDELARGEPPELAATSARTALHHLGRVTGETLEPEVLDAIFARFCIGK